MGHYEGRNWRGFHITRLNAEINRITQLFDVKAKLDDLGTRLKPMTPEKFTEFLHAEIAKYQKVAKETGVRME